MAHDPHMLCFGTGSSSMAHDPRIPLISTDTASGDGSLSKSHSAHTSPTSTVKRKPRHQSDDGDVKIVSPYTAK